MQRLLGGELPDGVGTSIQRSDPRMTVARADRMPEAKSHVATLKAARIVPQSVIAVAHTRLATMLTRQALWQCPANHKKNDHPPVPIKIDTFDLTPGRKIGTKTLRPAGFPFACYLGDGSAHGRVAGASSAVTLVRWVNENAFVSEAQTRPCPTFGRLVHLGLPRRLRPGTSPQALRFHLTVDTRPSGVHQAVASGRSWLCPAFAFVPV